MSNEQTVEWTGDSGTRYSYQVYPKNAEFREMAGNYIFTRQTLNGWDAVYIGEGILKHRTEDEVHLACANAKGFTHFHVHLNADEGGRKEEEADLIAGNVECLYENGGCNKTHDG